MRKLTGLLLVFALSYTMAWGQLRTISGKVTDDKGNPVPFATVKVKGARQGVSADVNGLFTIQAETGAVLEISGVGFLQGISTVTSGQNAVNVVLASDVTTLGEVVVTALGVQSQKDKLATSQSSVKGQAIARSGESSVLNGLSSKASGVQVSRSGGDPGAGSYIQIRGQSTITGDLQPLFIIDGIPVSNSSLLGAGTTTAGSGVDGTVQQSRLNDLNPDDVASVEVLKGAAAAALYGTRAANGVVLITTKKGKAGKISISYKSTYSLDKLNRSVPLQTNFGQGNNGLFQGGFTRSWGDRIADRTGGPDTYPTTGAYVILPDGSRRYVIANGTTANPHGGKNSRDVYDHSRDLFDDGHFFDNSLTLSGGDDRTTFYASLANMDQDGILKAGSDYHRKSFKLNVERKFGTVLKLSSSFDYSNVKSNRVQQGSNISGIFLGGLRSPADFNNEIYEGTYVDASGAIFPRRQISFRNPIGAATNSGFDNPFWIINKVVSNTAVNRLLGSFQGDITANSWLSFVARTGVDFYQDNRIDYFPALSAAYPGGSLTMQELSELQFNTDVFAKVNTSINKNFSVNGIVGVNYNNRNYINIGATGRNFILPDAPYDLANSAASARFPFNYRSTIRTTAVFAQATFDAYDQLFLTVTGRQERASTFANSFFYPSVSLGWQFTKLPVLSNNDALTFGKIRAAYGEVGVQPGPYLTGTYFVPTVVLESYGSQLDASSQTYGGGYSRSTIKGNPDIKPERKKEFEVGADLRFFRDRISLGGTYYSNKTTGAIFGVQVPASTGFTQTNDNAAEIENKGWEADLGITWVKKKDFSFTSDLVWSRNRNKVISLKGVTSFFLNGFTGVSSRAVAGQALGTLWGVGFARDEKGALVLDANGFPTANTEESVLGDPNPEWTGGITNTFTYKGFNFSFLIDHVQGGDVWNGTRAALVTYGTAAETGNTVVAPSNLKTYSGSTINAGTSFRGAVGDFGAGPVALTQAWYTDIGGGFGTATGPDFFEKGTRTRLREIALGYTLSGKNFTQKTKLQSIDFSVTGRNIALWTDYKGIDPETNLTGVSNGRGLDYFNNPSTKSFIFSIKVTY